MEFNFDPESYLGLEKLGRIPLSKSFHMREFRYSEIAAHYRLRNVPERGSVDAAISAGRELCDKLLEPLPDTFGRLHIRSGYRSRSVNARGVGSHNCAIDNDGFHTWDYPTSSGHGAGATACISIPSVSKHVLRHGADELAIIWWIYDNLTNWSSLELFSTPDFSDELACNIGWHEKPMKVIHSWRRGRKNVGESVPLPEERKRNWSALVQACTQ